MARVLTLDTDAEDLKKLTRRLLQSGNINFLLGSGASAPVIPVVGSVEKEIEELYNVSKTEADKKLYEFLLLVQKPMNTLIGKTTDAAIEELLEHYRTYLSIVELILSERRTDLLPKQANIFTTNYDLFIEKASEAFLALKLNDGFTRVPSLERKSVYSSRSFFDSVFARGPHHSYKVEMPCVNLLKLHGSFSWKKDKDNDEVLFDVSSKPELTDIELAKEDEIAKFVESYAVVLPERRKFQITLLDQIHYDLLRIFANELDKPNTLLVTVGFSFDDKHILHVTQRALNNPTLIVLVFAHTEADVAGYQTKFSRNKNVYIVKPATGVPTTFKAFNATLQALLPPKEDDE